MPAVPAPLVPDDDLYARLEVGSDASPEAIELAWRALLKLHHPDVAGDGAEALDRAKRINVAHDWLSDRSLRARYDLERAGPLAGASSASRAGSVRGRRGPGERIVHAPWRRRAPVPPPRPDLFRGDPTERIAWFLARVERLTPDELDRLSAAEPPPIAFLATVRRFITPEARAAFAAAEAALVARVPADRWAGAGCREGLLGVAAELVLSAFLDDMLAEPFRGRARERLLRGWDASVDQPRYGPNGSDVVVLRDLIGGLARDRLMAFLRASQGVDAGSRPWPDGLDRDEDEALRISALLAARDVAAAVPTDGLSGAAATRAQRLAARLGHVTALRHAFPAASSSAFLAPLVIAVGEAAVPVAAPAPGIRRAR